MKIIRNLVIIILIIVAIVYHGQAIKIQKIRAVRLKDAFLEGKISKTEYDRLKQQNTYFKAFLNKKEV